MQSWPVLSPAIVSAWDEFFQLGALTELGLIALALGLAWAVVRLLRGPHAPPGSIWFGRGIFDGVLFPSLWLALVWLARHLSLRQHWPVAIFKVAIPVLLSLVVIRLSVRVLSAAFPASRWMRLAERTISWLAWVAVVLWVTDILPAVMDGMGDVRWKIGGSTITLRNVVEGSLLGALVLVIVLWMSAAIETKLLRGATGDQLSLRKAAANSVRALLVMIGLLFALSAVGIDLTALSVVGGAIGVGLGFGLQKLASNYVSGFVILAERSLRIGDVVKVDGFEGRITDIATRYTVLRALNGREAIVPNEMLITQRVESSSLADPRVRVDSAVQVAYGTDVEALIRRMTEVVAAVPRVLADPPPGVGLDNFGADGLDLKVTFWITDPENGSGNVRSDVNLALLRLFNELGVEIPYPQRVVRVEGGSSLPPVIAASSPT